jgi:Lipocalin-like domain
MPNVTGTWRMVRAVAKDSAGNTLPTPYGGRAMGRVVLQDNGRMMAVVCDGATELPAGVKREYSSYCGNYTYDGKTLITKVDAASDPSRIGSDQVRGVRFEDELMVLSPPARAYNDVMEQRELYWEKLSDL